MTVEVVPLSKGTQGERRWASTSVVIYALASLTVFAACFVVTQFPDEISRPIVRWTNSFAGEFPVLDRVFLDFSLYATFSGAILCGLVLAHWLKANDVRERSKILVGTCSSFGAGIVSRFLQHHLSTHVRPYYDHAINFKPLPGLNIPALNTWNSFPSDHAAVFGGLVTVLFVARARERYFIAAWIFVVESSRTFVGAHFPSDLMGGAALASAVVWACQWSVFLRIGEWFCGWQARRPILFYSAFFMLLYQIATLFVEIRDMTGGFDLLRHLGPS